MPFAFPSAAVAFFFAFLSAAFGTAFAFPFGTAFAFPFAAFSFFSDAVVAWVAAAVAAASARAASSAAALARRRASARAASLAAMPCINALTPMSPSSASSVLAPSSLFAASLMAGRASESSAPAPPAFFPFPHSVIVMSSPLCFFFAGNTFTSSSSSWARCCF